MTTKRLVAYIFILSCVLMGFFLLQCAGIGLKYDFKVPAWFAFKTYDIMDWIFQILYTTIAVTAAHLIANSGSDAMVNG